MSVARPRARGSRKTKRINEHERELDKLYDRGLVRQEDARAQAEDEAVTCPHCDSPVHPSNYGAHMERYHADTVKGGVEIARIRTDGGTQSRAVINEAVVREYVDAVVSGAELPPVEVYYDGADYWLADGFHRVAAYRQMRYETIPADVKQGTRRDAVLRSVGANSAHGLRRTNADKRRAVMLLLEDEEWSSWSNREIARQCNVDRRFVDRLRQSLSGDNPQIETRQVTRGGTTYTMDTANIGGNGSNGTPPAPLPDAIRDLIDDVATFDERDPIRERIETVLEAAQKQVAEDAKLEKRERQRWMSTKKREQRKQERAAEDETAIASLPDERYRLIEGDFADCMAALEPESIDVIITDPPYGGDYISLYSVLAREAGRVLKPGGSLITMCGQYHLPNTIAQMMPHLTYHWTIAYLTPGGQSPQIFPRQVNTFWKPLLWFVKGAYAGSWVGDVVQSAVNDNDKEHHEWGQSVSGMTEIVERFTRPGQTILDPMMGAGTTGVAAVKLNRLFVGIDIDPENIQIALERLTSCLNRQ